MRDTIEKYYRQQHSALSEEDIEEQNCIHTPNEMINFALSVVKNCSIPDVSHRRELLAAFQRDYNKRNFEDSQIADQDIELFLAANCG